MNGVVVERSPRAVLLTCMLCFACISGVAQNAPPAADIPGEGAGATDAAGDGAAPSGPCAAPEHAQFDFWVGTWDVSTARSREAGRPASRNVIARIHGGCALREEYTTATGYAGTSLNYYDRRDGKWHQTWIDVQGNALRLVGGLEGGSMVMRFTAPDGARNRITWTPNDDGSVRQHWQQSKDGGEVWSDVFDGRYDRR